MVNKEIDKDYEKIKQALTKMATGFEYEEREIIADKNGVTGKVKISKKYMPPDINAIKTIMYKKESGKW